MADNPYSKMFQYPTGDTINLTDVISNAKKRLKNDAPYDSYKALQKYLQGIFYPNKVKNATQQQKNINAKIRKAMSEYLSDILKKTVNDYSFDQNKVNTERNAREIIPMDKYESFSHSQYIEVQTLENRIQKVKIALENLRESDFESNGKYQEIKKELEALQQQCEQLIKNGPRGSHKVKGIEIETIVIKGNDSLIEQLRKIDTLYQSLVYMYDMPIPNWLLGEVFEKSLNLAFQSIDYDNFAEKLVLDALKSQKTLGSIAGERGSLKLGMTGYEIVPQSQPGKTKNFTYEVKSPTSNKIFKIAGVFNPKQQKMDVELNFGNDSNIDKKLRNRDFRVSAKNWQTLSGSDFGETDLGGAILRNATLYDALTYGLQLGWFEYTENDKAYEEQLHHFARLNLLLDIVMGYSQERGYTNTIIINDRANGEIKVYSIRKILDNVKKQIIDLSKCSNYNEEKVKSILKEALDWTEHLNTQEYEALLLNALRSMKFNINTNILK